MSMERHGAELHFLRPDRVYRTSVLSPLPGYNPGVDVQAVAANFTSRGYDVPPVAGMSLSMAAPPLSFFQRLRLRVATARSEKRARRMMKQLAKINAQPSSTPTNGLHGPEPARQGMALVAAQISVGQFPLPAGARTKLQAGAAIIPHAVSLPASLAQQAVAGSPTYVSSRAAQYGFDNWANKRRGTFDY